MSHLVPPSSACSSSSSRPSTATPSLFSKDSCSTTSSAPDLAPRPFPAQATLPALDPLAKASTIRLPLQLPTPPSDFSEVDVTNLVVDDELGGAPVGFAVGKLRELGATLLNATTATCLHIPPGPTLAQYLQVSFPSSSSPIPPIYLPSHVLAIHSSDSPRTLLLPVHGLLWAAASAHLSILSSRPEKQHVHPSLPTISRPADGEAHLPVIELTLPSSAAFPLLQGWVYLRSPALLLSSLLPQPPTPPVPSSPGPPISLSHLLNPSSHIVASSPAAPPPQTPEALTRALAALPSVTLLRHVHLVHGLWQDVVALQVGDDELWRTMGLAWRVLVATLAVKERSRRMASPASGDEGETA
ncbi:hypothetical protein JCM3770_005650 [Rhodotorula araucariae]